MNGRQGRIKMPGAQPLLHRRPMGTNSDRVMIRFTYSTCRRRDGCGGGGRR